MAENTSPDTSGLTPDELEQRQRADGTFDEEPAVDADGPLDPDEIEQRQVIELDEDDEPRDA